MCRSPVYSRSKLPSGYLVDADTGLQSYCLKEGGGALPSGSRTRRSAGPSGGISREDDELLPEYDFASMTGGVRGTYVVLLRNGSNLVLLEPAIATAFPSDDAVNEALRSVLNTTRAVSGKGGLPNHALPPPRRAKRRATKAKRASAARG